VKIAFLLSAFPCLSETFILNQITGMIDRGHEVDIYAYAPRNEPFAHGDIERYGLPGRTVYFHHGSGGFVRPAAVIPRFVRALFLLAANLRTRPGCLLKSLNIIRYGKEAATLGLLFKTFAFLKRRYDVIYCHFGSKGMIGAMLKDIGAVDAKLVTSFHGADMSRALKQHGREIYRLLFARGDLFLPISEHWKKALIDMGCEEAKIAVHRMGIDTERFSAPDCTGGGNGKVTILSVARFVEKKGLGYGIEAVAKVLRRHRNITYRIVGDGPMRPALEQLIGTLQVGHAVRLEGPKTQDEVITCMKHSDILLAPSVTAADGDQEGIPVVLMEALAQGIPVVSTWHSGIPELVQNGKSGYLAPERNPDAIADSLMHLIEHPAHRKEMGERGRAHVRRDYDINLLNDRLVGHFAGLLGNGS